MSEPFFGFAQCIKCGKHWEILSIEGVENPNTIECPFCSQRTGKVFTKEEIILTQRALALFSMLCELNLFSKHFKILGDWGMLSQAERKRFLEIAECITIRGEDKHFLGKT